MTEIIEPNVDGGEIIHFLCDIRSIFSLKLLKTCVKNALLNDWKVNIHLLHRRS